MTELFNEQDRLSNFLALWVNQLMQNNIAPDEIRHQTAGSCVNKFFWRYSI